jgi:DNA-binding NtrC family response regulator
MNAKVVVLIVDDDHAVLETMRMLLDVKGGFDVHCAVGSQGASRFLSSLELVDVVIADVVLAGETTGIDICNTARRFHPDAGLIVISADPSTDASDMPAQSIYLRKPFGGQELLDAIDRVRAFTVLGLSDALPQA